MSTKVACASRGAALLVAALAVTCLGQQSAPAPAGAEAKVQVKVESEFVTVTAGERPVVRYRYEKGPKPYIKELYTPKGVQFLLDSPPDHVHHRGVMYAIAVSGVDFWAEFENCGKELNRNVKAEAPAPGADDEAVISQGVDWQAVDGKTVAVEQRSIRVHGGKDAAASTATLLTWRTKLELPPGVTEAPLTGNHYFGLGLRFVREMDKIGKFMNSEKAEGEVVRGDEKLYPGRWCAYSAELNGKPVTIAMFDGPDNVRRATWFTMADPFAYLSATLKLHKEPLTLKAGQPLELCYGLAAWDGEIKPEQIEKTYQLWLTRIAKTGKASPKPPEPK